MGHNTHGRMAKIWSANLQLAGGAPKGLFDHILGNQRHLAKGLISEKGRSPSMNSKIVM